MSNWYLQNGKDSDVVVSTRVRLARNLAGFKFENKCSEEEKKQILYKVEEIIPSLGYGLQLLKLKDMDEITKISLVEKKLITPDFIEKGENTAIAINKEENICIMINSEDHILLQTFGEGIALEELMNLAVELDQKMEKLLPYSYNEKYGYLTACPINVGTGARVSVTMHLPGLTKTGNLNKVFRAVNSFAMSITSVYGDENQNVGDMYQIFNNQTLGVTEQEIVKNMRTIVEKITQQERVARKYLGKNEIEFADKVYRAFGVLSNARLLNSNECLNLLSDVKLGTDMGIIAELNDFKVKKLYLYTNPCNLQKYLGKEMSKKERDAKRTEVIRQIINE